MTAALLASILATGFALGVIHAVDPDHLMTISALSARADSHRATLRHAAMWALGHGGLLIGVASAVMLLGWTLPAALPAGAERSVGAILIVAGLSAVWLRHPPHTHRAGLRERAPFAVGLIHGLAGSAAMLALLPATLYGPLAGLAYAAIFSGGVLVGMMGFGLVLAGFQQRIGREAPKVHRFGQVATGLGAIGMGVHWLTA